MIRRRRWRSVFGWTYSASAVALMLPRRRRNSSSVGSRAVERWRSYSASRRDRVAVRVANAGVERHPEEVLVRTELVVGHRPPAFARRTVVPRSAWRASSKPAAKLAAPLQALETPIETGGLELPLDPADLLDQAAPRRRAGSRTSAADRVVAAVEERPRRERLRAPSRGGRRAELAARTRWRWSRSQPRRAARPSRSPPHAPPRELLEEVLDQVLLGQPLDQLDLLDRDSRLVRDGAREVDLGRPLGRSAGRAAPRSRRAGRRRSSSGRCGRSPARARRAPSVVARPRSRAATRRAAGAPRRPRRAGRGGRQAAPRSSTLRAGRPQGGARRASRPGRSSRRAAVRCSSSPTRRRVSSYRRAFSIAPATSEALETRKSTSACVNSRGASVWSVIDADRRSVLREDRDRDERLEPLLARARGRT